MVGEKKDHHDKNSPVEKDLENGDKVIMDGGNDGGETDSLPSLGSVMEENEDLKNRMLYLHAELENFKKRMVKEKEQQLLFGNERLIRELIPLLDNFELALDHIKEDQNSSQLRSGVELIYNEFINVLKRFGVAQVDTSGEEFDPNFHDAVSRIHVENIKPGKIYQVVRKGYTLNDRLLRPVEVVVTAEPEKEKASENEGEVSGG